jgi:hypothetical protein
VKDYSQGRAVDIGLTGCLDEDRESVESEQAEEIKVLQDLVLSEAGHGVESETE